jgi:hypothetical protein
MSEAKSGAVLEWSRMSLRSSGLLAHPGYFLCQVAAANGLTALHYMNRMIRRYLVDYCSEDFVEPPIF